MPAVSKAQQKFFGAEIVRAKRGKRTRTGMPVAKLEEFASTPRAGLPQRARAPRRRRA